MNAFACVQQNLPVSENPCRLIFIAQVGFKSWAGFLARNTGGAKNSKIQGSLTLLIKWRVAKLDAISCFFPLRNLSVCSLWETKNNEGLGRFLSFPYGIHWKTEKKSKTKAINFQDNRKWYCLCITYILWHVNRILGWLIQSLYTNSGLFLLNQTPRSKPIFQKSKMCSNTAFSRQSCNKTKGASLSSV